MIMIIIITINISFVVYINSQDMLTFIATNPVMEGEMVESASTADVLFWVIHPVIEVLHHYHCMCWDMTVWESE